MESFNVITGLPRSGSTLLCNVLNQNPDFYASSTSPLPGMLATMSSLWSNSPEINGMLINDMVTANTLMEETLRAITKAWYKGKNIVFDKSRGWANNALLLKQLYPDAIIIVTVRDLRSVFGSIEKQHQKNPILDQAQTPMGKTLYTRADEMFAPQGIIGGPLFAIEDLIRRKPPDVLIVQYEAFAKDPGFVIGKIYEALKIEPFQHDFDNVENTADDVDQLYLGKFEHKGEGKIEPIPTDEWKQFVSADLGDLIMERYPFFNKVFSYMK